MDDNFLYVTPEDHGRELDELDSLERKLRVSFTSTIAYCRCDLILHILLSPIISDIEIFQLNIHRLK